MAIRLFPCLLAALLAALMCISCSKGCSKPPVAKTNDSRTKQVLGVTEWQLGDKEATGFEVITYDGKAESVACTILGGERVKSVYLQKSLETPSYILKLDAASGFYGTVIPTPFGDRIPRIHTEPVKHDGLWVLMNDQDGIHGSDGRMTSYIALRFTKKKRSNQAIDSDKK